MSADEPNIEGFHVSPQQLAAWRTDGRATLEATVIGQLDSNRFMAAVDRIVARHEILRSSVGATPPSPVPLQVIGTHRTFDAAIRSEGSTHQVRFDAAASLADRTTLRRLLVDALVAYREHAAAEPADGVDAAELQYADLAEWLSQMADAAQPGQEAAPAFWRSVLRQLPFGALGSPSTSQESANGRTVTTSLVPSSASRGVERLANAAACSQESVLALAVGWLITLRADAPSVAYAEVCDGRSQPELKSAYGPLARYLPVRFDLSPSTVLLDALHAIEGIRRDVRDWEDFFSWAHDPDTRHQPGMFLPHAIEFVTELERRRIGEYEVQIDREIVDVDRYHTKVVFHIDPAHRPTRMELFSRDLERDEIAMFVESILGILDQFGRDELWDQPLARVSTVGPLAYADAIAAATGAPLAWDPTVTITELLSQQCERTPDRPALVDQREALTYRELDRQSRSVAAALRAERIGPGSFVAILAPSSAQLIVAAFSVLRAGAAYVPLELDAPADRIETILRDADIGVVLSPPALRDQLPTGTTGLWLDDVGPTSEPVLTSAPGPGDLAYGIYTSGSTGKPKAVMVEHRQVVAFRAAMRACVGALQPGSHDGGSQPLQVALNAAITFDASVQQLVTLLDGHTLHVLDDELRRDDVALVEYLKRRKIDVLNGTPTQIGVLADAGLLDLGRHLTLLVAGEELPNGLWDRLAAAPGVDAYNIYGPTECTVNATATRVSTTVPSIGRPLDGYSAHVLDADLRPVGVGTVGEIYLGGLGVARGYLRRPDLTAERFVPDPFSSSGARLYRTGDRARRRVDGSLEFLGRADNQVKVRGFRIEPREVAVSLLETPDVAHALVRQESGVDESSTLVAYVVLKVRGALSESAIRSLLEERLPRHLIPTRIIEVATIPTTSSGKVDRRASLEDRVVPTTRDHHPPRTPEEQLLAAIWSSVTGTTPIGIDDNFFAIGGDSIRSIRVRSIAAEAGLQFSVQDLFRHQTIRELAPRCSETQASAEPLRPFELAPNVQRRRPPGVVDAFPLSARQRTVLEYSPSAAEDIRYQPYRILRLEGDFDTDAARRALREVQARHPMLRSTVERDTSSDAFQLIWESGHTEVAIVDLRGHVALEKAIEDELADATSRRFDLAAEHPIRVSVLLRGDRRFDVVFQVSEIAMDGWSVARVLVDFFTTYTALQDGTDPALGPAPDTSYGELIRREQAAIANAELKKAWRVELSNAPRVMIPPTMVGDDPVESSTGIEIASELSTSVSSLARTHGWPLKSVLLAVHLRVLEALSSSDAVVTGLVTSARPDLPDADRTVGQFLNRLPFQLAVVGSGWTELIEAAIAQERRLDARRHYPCAAIETDLGCEVFDTVFNFTHFHVYEGVASGRLRLVDDDFVKVTDRVLLVDFSMDPHDQSVRLTLSSRSLKPAALVGIGEMFTAALRDAVAAVGVNPSSAPEGPS
jgi:amino acid adenylation domain-containing protein